MREVIEEVRPHQDDPSTNSSTPERKTSTATMEIAEITAQQQQRCKQKGVGLNYPLNVRHRCVKCSLQSGQCYVDHCSVDKCDAGSENRRNQHSRSPTRFDCALSDAGCRFLTRGFDRGHHSLINPDLLRLCQFTLYDWRDSSSRVTPHEKRLHHNATQLTPRLFAAARETFIAAFPSLPKMEFLDGFHSFGCYLVDLYAEPVDQMPPSMRTSTRNQEVRRSLCIRLTAKCVNPYPAATDCYKILFFPQFTSHFPSPIC
jgi:hypothetical protein